MLYGAVRNVKASGPGRWTAQDRAALIRASPSIPLRGDDFLLARPAGRAVMATAWASLEVLAQGGLGEQIIDKPLVLFADVYISSALYT